MEYFASASALRDLRQRFAREGISGFPPAYQVVVKCRPCGNEKILALGLCAACYTLKRQETIMIC
jgi:hypothetical protein